MREEDWILQQRGLIQEAKEWRDAKLRADQEISRWTNLAQRMYMYILEDDEIENPEDHPFALQYFKVQIGEDDVREANT